MKDALHQVNLDRYLIFHFISLFAIACYLLFHIQFSEVRQDCFELFLDIVLVQISSFFDRLMHPFGQILDLRTVKRRNFPKKLVYLLKDVYPHQLDLRFDLSKENCLYIIISGK